MSHRTAVSLLAAAALLQGCDAGAPREAGTPDWTTVQDTTHRVAAVTGFAGPEAVRYDPDQDVYFVANFSGGGSDRDADGFISRVGPGGDVVEFRFMTGTDPAPLHAPRGMALEGDTLWAADVDGVHGFHRGTGEPLAFVDFTSLEPGFLNDVAVGPDGALYVTDTGTSRIYRMEGDEVTVAVENPGLGPPNGITWDAAATRFLLAPWNEEGTLRAWATGSSDVVETASLPGGRYDGIELVGSRVLVASQVDSTIHVVEGDSGRPLIRVPGRPADIGVDTSRRRIAVPYIALDRVDLWQLPGR